RWLELSGQRHLLGGEYSAALDCFARVVDICAGGGFPRATLGALLNQALVLLAVNQVSVAEEVLGEAADLADALGDRTATARAAWLFQLAEARSRSLVEGVGIAPTAGEMQAGATTRGTARSPAPSDGPSPVGLPQPANFLAFFEDRALAVQWALARG